MKIEATQIKLRIIQTNECETKYWWYILFQEGIILSHIPV